MSTNRNGIRRLPTRPPLQPQSSAGELFTKPAEKTPDWWMETQYQRRLLASERKSNGVIHSLLAKQVALLERQVADLRSAAIANTAAGLRPR